METPGFGERGRVRARVFRLGARTRPRSLKITLAPRFPAT